MRPSGREAIDRAKANGRWDAAYESPSRANIPEDLAAVLAANTRAKEFFETLDRANRYAILFRIQTAKNPGTRAKKIQQFISMLDRHEKIHP